MTAGFWDDRYGHPNHVFGYRPNDFLKQQARLLRPGSRVLCLGDGEGRNGVWLAQQGHDVVSLDFSRVGLDKAEALAAERGVTIETWHLDLADWVDLPDPADGEAAADDRDEVARLLARLTPQQRRIVVLRYFDDYTEAQTADCLGISVGTVKATCSRALARLRRLREPLREGDPT